MISANKHQGDDGCWDQQMLPEEFNDDETPTEEFDEEMNVIKVENLEFIPGILGQGNFGTVRLAKRKLSGGNSSSSSSCYSVQTSPRRRKNASKPAPSSIFNKFAVGESTENDGGKHNSFRRDFRHAFSTPPTHEYKNRRQNNYINLNMFSRSRDDIDSDDEETDNDQLVAVKIFSKSNLKRRRTIERDKNTKSVKIRNAYQQVEREIALMKKLSHPNLVQLYEVIDSPETDILYMVLEYMPLGEILKYQEHNATFKRSESLRHKKIDGLINGHFDEEQAALYFVDILHGLAYLHQHHICHRDLKPENILLSNKKIAKIGDFGVSHIFEEESENGPRRYLTSIEEDHQLHRHHLKTTAQSEKTIRRNTDFKMNETSSFSSSPPPSSSSSFTSLEESEHNPFVFSQEDFSNAYDMGAMAGSGILSKTEGTWCFWSPEMCNGSQGFSLYAGEKLQMSIYYHLFSFVQISKFASQNIAISLV
jgi:serine/threonine protein kinase